MLSDKRLAIIGGGNMGEAMLKGLLAAQLIKPQQITVTDLIEARLAYLQETYTVQALTDNVKAVAPADLIILAVKPQDIVHTVQGLAPVVDDQKVGDATKAATDLRAAVAHMSDTAGVIAGATIKKFPDKLSV